MYMFETTAVSIANMFGSDAYYYDPQDFEVVDPEVRYFNFIK